MCIQSNTYFASLTDGVRSQQTADFDMMVCYEASGLITVCESKCLSPLARILVTAFLAFFRSAPKAPAKRLRRQTLDQNIFRRSHYFHCNDTSFRTKCSGHDIESFPVSPGSTVAARLSPPFPGSLSSSFPSPPAKQAMCNNEQ